jgi:Rhodopirellula transposase DDE domain
MPWGSVDAESGEVRSPFGRASKTRDVIVDTRAAWGQAREEPDQAAVERRHIKMENGPESSGGRTQFLPRMVQWADQSGQPLQGRYSPPSHRTYTPLARCWGIVEVRGPGPKLVEVQTRLAWAKGMTWKGSHPVGQLRRKV